MDDDTATCNCADRLDPNKKTGNLMYIKLNIQKFYKDAVEVYQILARTSQIQYSN
jgi:hypothetical protein